MLLGAVLGKLVEHYTYEALCYLALPRADNLSSTQVLTRTNYMNNMVYRQLHSSNAPLA